MTDIDALFDALRASWNHETCVNSSIWLPNVPATGQCAVTALVVQDYLGGELLRAMNPEGQSGSKLVSHYWNRLPGGREVDLTRGQFWIWEPGEVVVRDRAYVLSNESTQLRYDRLRQRVHQRLGGSATLVLHR